MARAEIGEIRHECGSTASVRRDKTNKLYLACPTCGLLRYSLRGGQDYILNNATIYGPEGKPEPAEVIAPKPAPVKPSPASPAPPPAAPRKPMFSTLLDL